MFFLKQGKLKKCQICQKELSSQRVLRRHAKTHNSERKFLCKVCGNSYKRSDHLNEHVLHKHPQIERFLCMVCKTKFKKMADFKHHTTAVHANTPIMIRDCDSDGFIEKIAVIEYNKEAEIADASLLS